MLIDRADLHHARLDELQDAESAGTRRELYPGRELAERSPSILLQHIEQLQIDAIQRELLGVGSHVPEEAAEDPVEDEHLDIHHAGDRPNGDHLISQFPAVTQPGLRRDLEGSGGLGDEAQRVELLQLFDHRTCGTGDPHRQMRRDGQPDDQWMDPGDDTKPPAVGEHPYSVCDHLATRTDLGGDLRERGPAVLSQHRDDALVQVIHVTPPGRAAGRCANRATLKCAGMPPRVTRICVGTGSINLILIVWKSLLLHRV